MKCACLLVGPLRLALCHPTFFSVVDVTNNLLLQAFQKMKVKTNSCYISTACLDIQNTSK